MQDPRIFHISWIITPDSNRNTSVEQDTNSGEDLINRLVAKISPRRERHPNAPFLDATHDFRILCGVDAVVETICASFTKVIDDLTDMFMRVFVADIAVRSNAEAVVSGFLVYFFEHQRRAIVLIRIKTDSDDHTTVGQNSIVGLHG